MAGDRVLVFVPMYNAAAQVGRVLAQFTPDIQPLFSRIIVVDNRSTDGSLAAAAAGLGKIDGCEAMLLRNRENYGLGGSHKVAFDHAVTNGFDFCVVLHGDDQGDIRDLVPHLRAGRHLGLDALLGARFMTGSKLQGYSTIRTLGNQVFNLVFSAACAHRLYDLGSGLNLYRTAALSPRGYLRFEDNLTFNYYLVLASVAWRWRMEFFPLTWREEDQRSNVKMLRQTMEMLRILGAFTFRRSQFLLDEHRAVPRQYEAEVIQTFAPGRSPSS